MIAVGCYAITHRAFAEFNQTSLFYAKPKKRPEHDTL